MRVRIVARRNFALLRAFYRGISVTCRLPAGFAVCLCADVFGGQMMSCIRCHACAFRSLCFDPFLDLSLPIPKAKLSTAPAAACAP